MLPFVPQDKIDKERIERENWRLLLALLYDLLISINVIFFNLWVFVEKRREHILDEGNKLGRAFETFYEIAVSICMEFTYF